MVGNTSDLVRYLLAIKKKETNINQGADDKMTRRVKSICEILKEEAGGLDSIYEDYIISLVGNYGLRLLKEDGCLESCGVINGRQLYVLVDKKES